MRKNAKYIILLLLIIDMMSLVIPFISITLTANGNEYIQYFIGILYWIRAGFHMETLLLKIFSLIVVIISIAFAVRRKRLFEILFAIVVGSLNLYLVYFFIVHEVHV